MVVADLDACVRELGPLLGAPHDAVQPGRRIATVRREAGMPTALAFMTPRPQRSPDVPELGATCAASPSPSLALLATLGPAAAARADYVIEGRGFGHGVGMSQYGAYGYALREGRDFRWILGHYYPGTSVGRVAAARMRVLLRDTRAPKVCGATSARDTVGRRVRLRDGRVYAFTAHGAGKLRVTDAGSGRTRARLRAPVRVTGGASVCVRGTAINGVRNGGYRGALRLHRDDGRSVLAVNELGLESYLRGVVAAEMPASWATEALRAQAVVARSYALRSRRPDRVFDVYPDVRSQVYRGLAGEQPAAVAAVRATRALAVRYGVEIAQTFFHSTSGGRTAGNEEGFGGGLPLPYLRPVEDRYDDISPVHTWTVRLSDRQMARKLRAVRRGDAAGRHRRADHADGPRRDGRGGRGAGHRRGVRDRAAPAAGPAQPLVLDPPRARPADALSPGRGRGGFEPGWTDRAPSGSLAGRMYARSVIATQPEAALNGRTVVACAQRGTGMAFDLPRGS